VLNAFFVGLVLLAVVVAAFTGHMQPLSTGALDSAKKAVELSLGLVGAMSLFLGLMRIAQDGGMLRLIARATAPIMRRLFPEVPEDHPAMSAMILNIACNVLGLGNAATPFGVRAMQELDALNPVKGTATNPMVLFLAINTAGFAILPTTVVALRASVGSKDPAGIIVATWLASGCATVAAIAAAKLFQRLPRFKADDPGAMTAILSASALEAPEEAPRVPPRGGSWVAGAYVVALAAALAVHLVRESDGVGWPAAIRGVLSFWMIPLLIAGLVLFGWARGVKVYESVVEGAKDGFQVALRIIPFLVAILVAVGMFRDSGCLELFVSALSPLTSAVGLPPEAIPMVLLRPMSGSGSYGVMSGILTAHGPDSYLGYLASTLQGSTDTTFYVLAVYFGAVGIKKTRHAVPAGLVADVAGITAAIAVSRLLWGALAH
jgi:spore maturation protein SpmA